MDDALRAAYEDAARKIMEGFLWPELRRLGIPDPESYVLVWGEVDDGRGVHEGLETGPGDREGAPVASVEDAVPAGDQQILVKGDESD